VKNPKKQSGYALLILMVLLTLAAATLAVKTMSNNSENSQISRDKITAAALAQAKDALIGYSATYKDTHPHVPFYMNGYLPNPDMGPSASIEGTTSGSFSGNNKDYSSIGKIPWKTLGISPLRDGQNECLWYVVSGRYKNNPQTSTLNWDTQGQINVVDKDGSTLASNLAALIISPGKALDAQSRTLIDDSHIQCSGNYDTRNYLDAYNGVDAISGTVNYYSGSTNNSRATDTNNKTFVLANAAHYNDQMIFITTSELFRDIVNRADFRNQINALMNDAAFQNEASSVPVSVGSKGTANINCNNTSNSDNQNFCTNWKEMLLLTKLPASASITIDGTVTANCSRVLIFGGQKTATQIRLSSTDKSTPANYIEGNNLTGFATPTSAGSNFNGASTFNALNPSADLLRCIP
jgi:uncharacterized protein (UPF0333 family)